LEVKVEFFTADEHYEHAEVIRHCDRPIKSIKQMDQHIIFKQNEVVTKDDEVWHIGDFSMLSPEFAGRVERKLRKLKGRHHLVLGNHDRIKPFNYVNMGFTSVHTVYWFEKAGYRFVLAHDPSVYTVCKDTDVFLHGHIHNLFRHLLPAKRVINVGVDVWNFAPVSFKQILELLYEYDARPVGG